jgi:chlorobactene glucosyltransferase
MTPFLLALPWLGLVIFVRFVVRIPRELPAAADRPTPPDVADAPAPDTPFVSVVVPARNERLNIERCLRSLTASRYPEFEVVVIDDRSEDETAARAAAVPAGNARDLRVIRGAELPEGWLGKPWACHQGADAARGELLLFTDADTTHAPDLLGRAVAGLREERADLLTVVGRQLMETFWERLVQPHIFLMMLFRFPSFEDTARNRRWRDAIANGQFMLFPRRPYDLIGGHAAVRDEVAEDLVFAQHVKRAGLALRIRGAEDDLATRMYRSLGDLVAGWSKNLFVGGRQACPRILRPVIMPLALVGHIGLWLAAPVVFLVTMGVVGAGAAGAGAVGAVAASAVAAGPVGMASVGAGSVGGDALGGPSGGVMAGLLLWSGSVYALSSLAFGLFTRQMGAPGRYGLLYPLGALMTTCILVRSWMRGSRVEWKGRQYTLRAPSDWA